MLKGDMIDVEEIQKLLQVKLLGVVPEDDKINCSLNNTFLTEADEAYTILAQNLYHNEDTIFNYKNKYKGILGRIKRVLRSKV